MNYNRSDLKKYLIHDALRVTAVIGDKTYHGYRSSLPINQSDAERQLNSMSAARPSSFTAYLCGVLELFDGEDSVASESSEPWLYLLEDAGFEEVAQLAMLGYPRDYNSPSAIRRFMSRFPESRLSRLVKSGTTTVERISGPTPKAQTRSVLKLLRQIHARSAFDIRYIDRCGLKAAFQKPVSQADAIWMADQIMAVNPQVLDALHPADPAKYISHMNEFRLWWD